MTLCEVGQTDESKLGVIELVEAGSIEGRVVDGRSGKPLANMSVACGGLAISYTPGMGPGHVRSGRMLSNRRTNARSL